MEISHYLLYYCAYFFNLDSSTSLGNAINPSIIVYDEPDYIATMFYHLMIFLINYIELV